MDIIKGTEHPEEFNPDYKKAQEKIVKFIESYFVTTLEPDGTKMHHIDDAEWQSVKERALRIGYRKPGEPLSPEERDITRKAWLSSQPQFFDDLIAQAAQAQLDKGGG